MMTWEARFGLGILGLRILCLSEEVQGKRAWPMAHPLLFSGPALSYPLCVATGPAHSSSAHASYGDPREEVLQADLWLRIPQSQAVGFSLGPRSLCPGARATSRAEPSEARGLCNLGLRKLLLLRLYCETSSTLIYFSLPCFPRL